MSAQWQGYEGALKLNLGCGKKHMSGYVNIDAVPCGGVDKVLDLDAFPWPYGDGSVDVAFSEHWLEHVADFDRTVREIHRVLRKGGVFRFVVPHWRSPMAVWHLHRWQFSAYTPELLCQELPYQYGGARLFDKVSVKVRVKTGRKALDFVLNRLSNMWPYAWDWLGLPIDEVEFVGRKA